MNVGATSYMQQAQVRKLDGTATQSIGKAMRETLSQLPQESQEDIKSLMQSLNSVDKRDSMLKMSEIDSANMTVEDLTKAIMDIFQPTKTPQKSSYPSSFSVYA